MSYKKYCALSINKYCAFFVELFVALIVYIIYLKFCPIFSEPFLCMQIKLELFSPEIVFVLEKQELLSHFRGYRKSA